MRYGSLTVNDLASEFYSFLWCGDSALGLCQCDRSEELTNLRPGW